MKPTWHESGWLNQEDAHWTITCSIGMDCACLCSSAQREHCCPLPWPLCSAPSPSYKKLCLYWRWRWALRHEFPIFQVTSTQNTPLSFTWAPASWLLAFLRLLAGESKFWVSLDHTGRRRVVLGHTLNTQTLMKTKKSHHVSSKFTILCWAAFIAIPDHIRPVGPRLGTPGIVIKIF